MTNSVGTNPIITPGWGSAIAKRSEAALSAGHDADALRTFQRNIQTRNLATRQKAITDATAWLTASGARRLDFQNTLQEVYSQQNTDLSNIALKIEGLRIRKQQGEGLQAFLNDIGNNKIQVGKTKISEWETKLKAAHQQGDTTQMELLSAQLNELRQLERIGLKGRGNYLRSRQGALRAQITQAESELQGLQQQHRQMTAKKQSCQVLSGLLKGQTLPPNTSPDDAVPCLTDSIPLAVRRLETQQQQHLQKAGMTQPPLAAQVIMPGETADPWPGNVIVGAASDQNRYAYDYVSSGAAKSMYFERVMVNLNLTGSLSEAIIRTTNEGYTTDNVSAPDFQFPTRSLTTFPAGNKQETQRPRKVIIIEGEADQSDTDERRFSKVSNHVSRELKKQFNLADQDIVRLEAPSQQQLSQAFAQLKAQGTPDSEVVIVLTGHGHASGMDPGVAAANRHKEGALQGKFDLQPSSGRTLGETELKKLVRDNLGTYRGVLILNLSCKSGSTVAENTVPNIDSKAGTFS